MPLPSPLNPYTGLGIATLATAGARRRPAPTDHAVARDPNPPARPQAPTGEWQALAIPAERMEIHVVEERSLTARAEGRFSTWIDAQFNPAELSETISPVWHDIVVQLFERRHFSHVKCVPFKFELAFDGYEFMETSQHDPFEKPGVTAGAEYVDAAVKFLRSLAFPDEETGSPPRCLFYWPNFISLTATIDEIAFKHTAFARTGHIMRSVAAITLREIRYQKIDRTNVLAAGNRRSSPPEGVVG